MAMNNYFADFKNLLGLVECWNPQLKVARPTVHIPLDVYCNHVMQDDFARHITMTVKNTDGSWQICTQRETTRGTMLHAIHTLHLPYKDAQYFILSVATVETRIPTLLADEAIRING